NLSRRIKAMVNQTPGISRTDLRRGISHNTTTETFNSALSWLIARNDIVCIPCYEERQVDRYYPMMGIRGRRVGDDVDEKPNAPNAHVQGTETGASEKPNAPNAHVPMTLSELIDWRNANAVRFVRLDESSIGLSSSELERLTLTPAIEQAIRDNQDTLSAFVHAEPVYSSVTIEDAGTTLLDDELDQSERHVVDANGYDATTYKHLRETIEQQGVSKSLVKSIAMTAIRSMPDDMSIERYVEFNIDDWVKDEEWQEKLIALAAKA
ncbi:MAG: hypothetical protein WD030_00495, partial [Pirellulales bacterium]